MTFHTSSQQPTNYYRLVVATAHLGRCKTEYATVFVRTALDPFDLMFNCGKPIAGIKRVVELQELSEEQFLAAVASKRHCFVAAMREVLTASRAFHPSLHKLRRARRYNNNRERARLENELAQ
ncbi:MAG: hypothetical protein ACYC63_08595 [Armatimonadota bacterium]